MSEPFSFTASTHCLLTLQTVSAIYASVSFIAVTPYLNKNCLLGFLKALIILQVMKPHAYFLYFAIFYGSGSYNFFHVTVTFVNMPSNKEDCVLIKICVSLMDRLHRN